MQMGNMNVIKSFTMFRKTMHIYLTLHLHGSPSVSRLFSWVWCFLCIFISVMNDSTTSLKFIFSEVAQVVRFGVDINMHNVYMSLYKWNVMINIIAFEWLAHQLNIPFSGKRLSSSISVCVCESPEITRGKAVCDVVFTVRLMLMEMWQTNDSYVKDSRTRMSTKCNITKSISMIFD